MDDEQTPKALSLTPIWSNASFLIPAFAASQKGLMAYALLIIITAVVSYWHNRNNSEVINFMFQILALGLVSTNLYILYLSGWRQPYFAIALIVAAITGYVYFKGNKNSHDVYSGLWRLLSAIFTLMCVLAH